MSHDQLSAAANAPSTIANTSGDSATITHPGGIGPKGTTAETAPVISFAVGSQGSSLERLSPRVR